MPEITQIAVEKKGRRRERAIYLDGERALTVTEATYLKLGLSVGQTIEDGQIREIETTDGISRGREDALRLLNHRPRTRYELEQRLTRKGWTEGVVIRVLDNLERAGLIDDTRFARLWVDERMRTRPSGLALLRRELRRKGVHEDIIEPILKAYDQESDEVRRACDLLQRRQGYYAGLDPQVAKRRMLGLLARRGFDAQTMYTAVQHILDNMEEQG